MQNRNSKSMIFINNISLRTNDIELEERIEKFCSEKKITPPIIIQIDRDPDDSLYLDDMEVK